MIAFLFVIFYRDWQLALGAFIVLPLAFYPILIFGRRVRRFSTGTQETMAELNSFLHETFSGSKIIKIFNLQDFEKNRFKEKTRHLFDLEMKKSDCQGPVVSGHGVSGRLRDRVHHLVRGAAGHQWHFHARGIFFFFDCGDDAV